MKKRIVRFLAFALVLSVALPLLYACELPTVNKTSALFNEIYKSTLVHPTVGGYTKAETVALPDGITQKESAYRFLHYLAEDTHSVYNVDLGKVVLTVGDDRLTAFSDVVLYEEYICLWLTDKDGKETTELYREDGKLLAACEGKENPRILDGAAVLEDTMYLVDNKGNVRAYALPAFSDSLVDEFGKTLIFDGSYMLYKKSRSVVYYDESFTPVCVYSLPETAHAATVCTSLGDGKLFVGYLTLCDPLSAEYDFYDTDAMGNLHKYKQSYVLFDAATQRTKQLALSGIRVSRVYNRENGDIFSSGIGGENYPFGFDDVFTENVENIIAYSKITDGILEYSVHYALLGNDGRLGAVIDEFTEGQIGPVCPLNTSYYYAKTKTGFTVLDLSGKKVYDTVSLGGAREFGYYDKDTVYNAALDAVLTLDGKDASKLAGDGYYDRAEAVLYCRTEEGRIRYFLYGKAGERELTVSEGQTLVGLPAFEENYVTVTGVSATAPFAEYRYVYSYTGELLAVWAQAKNGNALAEGKTAALFYALENGKTVYYRLYK